MAKPYCTRSADGGASSPPIFALRIVFGTFCHQPTHAARAETAGGLCRARRRKTSTAKLKGTGKRLQKPVATPELRSSFASLRRVRISCPLCPRLLKTLSLLRSLFLLAAPQSSHFMPPLPSLIENVKPAPQSFPPCGSAESAFHAPSALACCVGSLLIRLRRLFVFSVRHSPNKFGSALTYRKRSLFTFHFSPFTFRRASRCAA